MLDSLLTWLAETWQSIADWFNDLLLSILNWFEALPLNIYEHFLNGTLQVFDIFTPPQFIQDGLQSVISGLPHDVGYFLGMSGLAQGLAVYSTAVVFRMIRRLMPYG